MPIDMSTGLSSAAAITAGLLIARRSGKGTTIHASLLQTSLFLLSELAQRQDGSFLSIEPIDAEQTGFHPAERIYKTNDGWIALAARSNGTARELLQVLGIAGASDVPRAMWGNREAGAIAEAIVDLTTNDALNLLSAGGIWAARCDDRAAAHVLFNPVLVASGLVGVAPDTRSGEVRQIGTGLGGSSFARPNSFALPELGQDSDNILAGLGFDKAEILAMRNEGILI